MTEILQIPSNEELQLITGIVPALVTPFNDDPTMSVNYDAIPVVVNHLLDAGIGGLFINGSTAEVPTLTQTERKAIAEKVMDTIHAQLQERHIPIIAHVGATTVENAVSLAEHAEQIGAAAVGTLPPMDRENSSLESDVAYYRAVGEATNLPLYVYWRSDMIKNGVRPADFLEAMKTVPNFAGIKFVDPDFHKMLVMGRMSKEEGKELNLLTGPDEMFLGGQAMGSHGAIGSTYNIMPNRFVAIHKGYQEVLAGGGNMQELMRWQAEASELIELMVTYGVVTAATKAIMAHRGLPVGGCRPGNTLGAHTETGFRDTVKPEQLKALLAIVDKYDLR